MTPTCLALSTLCAMTSVVWAAAPGKALLAKAQKEDKALRGDEKRLRLRHHGEKLIDAWEAAVQATNGADRITALKGEAEAWHLLAHWSGRGDDLAMAKAIEAKLQAESSRASRVAKSEPKSKAKAEKSSAPAREQKGPVFLSKVEVVDGEDGPSLLLTADGAFTGTRSTLPPKPGRAPRIYFDLSPMIGAMEVLGTIKVADQALSRVRVGQFDADTVRVVIDYRGTDLPEVLPALEDEQIALHLGGDRGALASASTQDRAAVSTASATAVLEGIVAEMKNAYPELTAEVEVEAPPAVVADASYLKQSTREALGPRSDSILQIRRVVIDAGHGGKDQGAVGAGGTQEKDVNLAIARKLGEQLEQKGLKVSYTRTTDKFLSLRDRSLIANKSGADLFISVHANAHTKKKIHGIETYYLNVTGDRYSERLARRENALEEGDGESPEPGVGMSEDSGELPTGALGQDLRLILADLAMRSATTESKRLAGYVQGALVGSLRRQYDDVKDLGVKHALFYVLLGTRMPSVLIETGFVTHPKEGRRLASKKYQDEVARSIAQGVLRFVEERQRLASRDEGGRSVIARAAP